MPIDRDDTQERLARIEQMMDQYDRAKPRLRARPANHLRRTTDRERDPSNSREDSRRSTRRRPASTEEGFR